MLLPDILVVRITVPGRSVIQHHTLLRPDHVVKCGSGERQRIYGRLSNGNLDSALAGRRLRYVLRLVAPEKNEQATLGAGMLDRDPHQRFDELAEYDLTRHRLGSLDHRPDVQLLDGRADGRGA